MTFKTQKGSVITFLLPMLAVGAVCAYLFSIVSTLIPAGGPVPYVFVSIFIFPIAAIWPLLKDLTELQEIDSITFTERRRLLAMVLDLQRYLKASAFMLLFFGVATGVMLYLVVIDFLNTKLALSGIGFFLGCGICVFTFLFNLRVKIQNYKAKIKSRFEELKQSKKLLNKVNGKSKKKEN